MIKLKYILIVVALVFTGCTKSNYKLAQTQKPIIEHEVTDKSIEYRILTQDRLAISLYKDPSQGTIMGATNELGQRMNTDGILVDASGFITLPLVGKIKVEGLTQTEASTLITRHYKKYLNAPSIYLEVMNKRIFVLGEVKNPGVVKLDKEKMTLFEAIAFAGDLTDYAVRDSIIILSNNAKRRGMQMRRVDLTNFDTMNYAALMLRPNDIVYVQPDNWKEFRVSSGNILSPFEAVAKAASPFVTLKYLTN